MVMGVSYQQNFGLTPAAIFTDIDSYFAQQPGAFLVNLDKLR